MSSKIGFTADKSHQNSDTPTPVITNTKCQPKKSVVQVHFPVRDLTCAYYNDAFDLQRGDIVYVDGKLEGLRGIVVDVAYTFKIKISDYKRVIGKADTDITGELHMAGSHFVALDPSVIPFEKIISWFKAPATPEDEYVSSSDHEAFPLDDLSGIKINPHTAERGEEYYMKNKVVYISVDGTRGHAIVEGSKPYEVEFTYRNNEISDLVCSCYCSSTCKHEFAAILQLREILRNIGEHYSDRPDYFAAISKSALFSFAVDRKENGSFILG